MFQKWFQIWGFQPDIKDLLFHLHPTYFQAWIERIPPKVYNTIHHVYMIYILLSQFQ
jgi:hypothetical protein